MDIKDQLKEYKDLKVCFLNVFSHTGSRFALSKYYETVEKTQQLQHKLKM